MNKNLLLLTCAAGALSAWAGASHAATAEASAASQTASTVGEIVVVAEHRETALQKIPVAVSVFNGAQRDTIGINTVQDVTNFAPGFTYDTTTTHPYIRGVGRQSVNVTDDERVASYEDEFFVYTAYELKQSSLFLTQEQIQRGPQNVGGRNAAAGSIDMISVRPTDTPYAEFRGTAGNFGTWNLEAAASGEIAPNVTARVAASYLNQDDGYYNNLSRNQTQGGLIHEWYTQAQIDWKPNDKADLWIKGFWSEWNDNQGDAGARSGFVNGSFDEVNLQDSNDALTGSLFPNANYGYAAIVPSAAAGHNPLDQLPTSVTLGNPAILNNAAQLNPFDFTAVDPKDRTVNLKNYRGISGIFTYDMGGWQVKYITGIQGYDYDLDFQDGEGAGFGSSNVISYTLPGTGGNCALLASPVNCELSLLGLSASLPGIPLFAPTKAALNGLALGLPAASPLVINPTVNLHYTEDDYWWSHEITFQSTDDKPLQWQVGAWYYKQHYSNPVTTTDTAQPQLSQPVSALAFGLAAANPTAAFLPLIPALEAGGLTPAQAAGLTGFLSAVNSGLTSAGVAPNPNDIISFQNYIINVQSVAGYGQASYKINDQWKVTGNVRYSDDSKGGLEFTRFVAFAPQSFVEFLGANTPSLDATLTATCPTGTPASAANPLACFTGPLAKGVASIGTIDPNTGIESRRLQGHSSAFTGGAGVEFTPTNDIFVYARYSRGYEDIAFNAGNNSSNPEVAPEFLNSYEIGYKQNFGGKLRIDIAAFYYDYQDIQLPITVNVGGTLEGQFINAPKAESTGVELEGVWSPIKNFAATLSYSYDYTAIKTGCTGTVSGGNFTANPGALCLIDTNDPNAVAPSANPAAGQNPAGPREQSIKGNPLPDAPLNKIALNLAYTWNFEPGDLTLSGSFEWRDVQDGTVFNRFYDNAPSWYGIDLRALWRAPKDKYEIIAFVKNLTDTLQYQTGTGGQGLTGNNARTFNPATGLNWTNTFNLSPPRTFGVEMRYKFF